MSEIGKRKTGSAVLWSGRSGVAALILYVVSQNSDLKKDVHEMKLATVTNSFRLSRIEGHLNLAAKSDTNQFAAYGKHR
jgi:hypothetical protein